MDRLSRKEFNEIIKSVMDFLPPAHPVRVRRTRVDKDSWGACELLGKRKKYFRISIDRSLDRCGTLMVFAHEYAHVLAWGKGPIDHSAEWGISYARVWEVLFEEKNHFDF